MRKKLLEFQAKNKSFSVRALAKRIGMQPGATNEILKGERRVSRKIAEKIAEKLQLDPTERMDLLKDFPEKMKRNSKFYPDRNGKELEAMKLTSEQFSHVAEWIHFAILSLMNTSCFKSDLTWIADRFGVTTIDVDTAIERMIKIGLIFRENNGELTRTSSRTNTTDDVLNLSLQKAHMSDMEMAKEKIQNVPVDQRDFSFLIFNANPKYLPRAKEILRKAQDDLEEIMDQDEAHEVYKVCTYLYPLSVSKRH
jgi:uncharacterized protein (TIGR02147 family)